MNRDSTMRTRRVKAAKRKTAKQQRLDEPALHDQERQADGMLVDLPGSPKKPPPDDYTFSFKSLNSDAAQCIATFLTHEDLLNVSLTHRSAYGLFHQARHHHLATYLAQQVANGNQDKVKVTLKKYPSLLTISSQVNDFSGRKLVGTAFQIALRTGDGLMAKAIKTIYLSSKTHLPHKVLETQINEVFPDGFHAHVARQKDIAETFERDYVDPLVDAITHAADNDLTAARNNRNNGSVLCQALNTFRKAFSALSHSETIFNPYHTLNAFKKYLAQFDDWLPHHYHTHDWLRRNVFACNVIGYQQRFWATNHVINLTDGLSRLHCGRAPSLYTLPCMFPVSWTPDFYGYSTRKMHFNRLIQAKKPRLGYELVLLSSCDGQTESFIFKGAAEEIATNYEWLVESKAQALGEALTLPQPVEWSRCAVTGRLARP